MDKDALENMARELFYKNAAGWRNAVPWDELHEDTRQIYRDHVLLIDAIVSSEKLQPTPRTDAFYFPLGVDHSSMRHPDVLESVDFARQLERELTESEAERLEQARLLGMSAQLELKLRAELEAAQSARAAIIEECAKVCEEMAERQSKMANGEMETYRKARAWDMYLCAVNIRALASGSQSGAVERTTKK